MLTWEEKVSWFNIPMDNSLKKELKLTYNANAIVHHYKNLGVFCHLFMQAYKGSKHTITIPLEFKYSYLLFQDLNSIKKLVDACSLMEIWEQSKITSGLSCSTCSRTKQSELPLLNEPSYFMTKFLPLKSISSKLRCAKQMQKQKSVY